MSAQTVREAARIIFPLATDEALDRLTDSVMSVVVGQPIPSHVPVCGHKWVGGKRIFTCYVELNSGGWHEGDHRSGPDIVISRDLVVVGDFPRPTPWLIVRRSEAMS